MTGDNQTGGAAAAGCIAEAARFLAAQPGAVERVFRAHRPAPDGRCRACGPTAPAWPCVIVTIARHARATATPGQPR